MSLDSLRAMRRFCVSLAIILVWSPPALMADCESDYADAVAECDAQLQKQLDVIEEKLDAQIRNALEDRAANKATCDVILQNTLDTLRQIHYLHMDSIEDSRRIQMSAAGAVYGSELIACGFLSGPLFPACAAAATAQFAATVAGIEAVYKSNVATEKALYQENVQLAHRKHDACVKAADEAYATEEKELRELAQIDRDAAIDAHRDCIDKANDILEKCKKKHVG